MKTQNHASPGKTLCTLIPSGTTKHQRPCTAVGIERRRWHIGFRHHRVRSPGQGPLSMTEHHNQLELFVKSLLIFVSSIIVQSQGFHCSISIHVCNGIWSYPPLYLVFLLSYAFNIPPFCNILANFLGWVSLWPFHTTYNVLQVGSLLKIHILISWVWDWGKKVPEIHTCSGGFQRWARFGYCVSGRS
jgi:hypothetical protein